MKREYHMNNSLTSRYSRGATWLLVVYLSFALSGCSFRPTELAPEEARVLQTRDFNGSPEEVAKAITIVLQEMHYSLGNMDMGMGIMTASRKSERSLAPISIELGTQEDVPDEVKTFCLIAGAVAVVALMFAWILDESDDNDDDDDDYEYHDNRSHNRRGHSGGTWFGGSDNSGPDSYTYSMTINLEELPLQQTRVRVTVQGQHLEGASIVESGPVQDRQVFIDSFNRLHTTLNR